MSNKINLNKSNGRTFIQWNIQNIPTELDTALRMEILQNSNYKYQFEFVRDAVREKIKRETELRNNN